MPGKHLIFLIGSASTSHLTRERKKNNAHTLIHFRENMFIVHSSFRADSSIYLTIHYGVLAIRISFIL